jgi:di/tripeptidase
MYMPQYQLLLINSACDMLLFARRYISRLFRKDVKPIIHYNYQGQDLVLPDDHSQVIRCAEHPDLPAQIGNDIITASGKTLLGADNKAGVAEIMDAAYYLMTHPEFNTEKLESCLRLMKKSVVELPK